MEYVRRLKKYVLGQDLSGAHEPTTSNRDAPGSASATHATSDRAVPAPAPPSRQHVPPLLQNAGTSGGVQGLSWYTSGMKEDCDGDVALEFLEELADGPAALCAPVDVQSTQHPTMKVQMQDLKAASVDQVSIHQGGVRVDLPK